MDSDIGQIILLLGEYHLLIEDVALEDDAPYECQVGQSEDSQAITSQTVWLTVQSKQSIFFFYCLMYCCIVKFSISEKKNL